MVEPLKRERSRFARIRQRPPRPHHAYPQQFAPGDVRMVEQLLDARVVADGAAPACVPAVLAKAAAAEVVLGSAGPCVSGVLLP